MTTDREPPPAPNVAHHFDHDMAASRGARDALVGLVGTGKFADDVRLAASELVANVIRHTSDGGDLLAWDTDPLRLEVHDTDPRIPQRLAAARPEALGGGGGLGLAIVDSLSTDWGAEPTPHGKVVWAEFQRPRP
jgi:anti-sigma regulatory factor (Ser/Thr protein kinase)